MMSGNRTHEQAIYKILPILVVKVHNREWAAINRPLQGVGVMGRNELRPYVTVLLLSLCVHSFYSGGS